ncbi:MAG: BamA/TamA family outer membrane protein [Deltaproteobacteria bacterium]|nr:BamA/TamA family outer membrane protein [Deltaproteobacteria bacterium]
MALEAIAAVLASAVAIAGSEPGSLPVPSAGAPESQPASAASAPGSLPASAASAPDAPLLQLEDDETWTGLEHPRYLVERIRIRGNERTAESVIMARIMVRPGEILDEERVELSRVRLLATGYFTAVDLRLERGSERGRVVLLVEVSERPPLPVIDGLYLGFSETTPFFGGLSAVDPNFFGRGLELGGGFVAAPEQQSYRARIAGADLFGSPLGARLALLFLRGREPVALGDDARGGGSINYLRGGGLVGISINAGSYQRFMVDYHGELIDADLRLDPRVKRTPLIQPGTSYLSALEFSYQRDSRDRTFVPTSGSNLFLGVELSSVILLSAYEYSRYHLTYEQYIPTFAHHSFSLRFDLGVIQPGVARGNNSGAPFFEAYYIGDYSYFRRNRNSLPRQLGLNLSAFSTYDDILGSLNVGYAFPLFIGGDHFYRIYLYAAVNLAEGTTMREIQGLDPGDDRFPVTFDTGLKFDTVAGSFVISASYLVDLLF